MEESIQHPNYDFKSLIGKGGMATVYLGEHKTLHKLVAIKVLNKEFLYNDNVRNRFLAEARNMFTMSHPNVIKVTDLIDQEDLVAFVMEYIEGQTLKEYLEKKGNLSNVEIEKLLPQILDAVEYVHEEGFIHRDIKPSNFLLSDNGVVKLLDFGIAKNTDQNSDEYTQTGTTQNIGTPMYMSPEQIKSAKDVTAQSDIYSLGVVLWQMVVGKKPYETETISIWELQTKIVNEPLPATSTKWDSTIQIATSKDLSKRYESVVPFKSEILNLIKTKSSAPKASIAKTETKTESEKEVIDSPGNKTLKKSEPSASKTKKAKATPSKESKNIKQKEKFKNNSLHKETRSESALETNKNKENDIKDSSLASVNKKSVNKKLFLSIIVFFLVLIIIAILGIQSVKQAPIYNSQTYQENTQNEKLPLTETEKLLVGKRVFGIQFIYDQYGSATINKESDYLHILGEQYSIDKSEYAKINGKLYVINETQLSFQGNIQIYTEKLFPEDCCGVIDITGSFTFRKTGDRQFWRLQEISKLCECKAYYLDIFE